MDFCIDAPVVEIPSYPAVVFIDRNSEISQKNFLATIARYFKREMRFDNLQYDQSMYHNEDLTGFLFLQRAMDLVKNENHFPSRVVGGGVFVKQGDSYELDWVWLHPFFRNRKILRGHWKQFKQRFGQFSVDSPLSAHMSNFVGKHHAPDQSHKQVE